MCWPTVSVGVHLKQVVEGGIGRLHAEVGGEDEQRVPDRLDNLFRRVLGLTEGLLAVVLRGKRRFEVGNPLAQGGHVLGQRHGWGRSVVHLRCSSLGRTRHALDPYPLSRAVRASDKRISL